jgi:hypothetical protein
LVAQQMLHTFVLRNCYQVLKQVVEAADHYKLPLTELLLELDFCADIEPGGWIVFNKVHFPRRLEAPAVKCPPEFKVFPTKTYRSKSVGGLGQEPEWFPQGPPKCERTVAGWQACLEDQYSRMARESGQLLACIRDAGSGFGVYRLHLLCKSDAPSIFSEEAVNAFRRFLKQGDCQELDRFFSTDQVMEFMLQQKLTLSSSN